MPECETCGDEISPDREHFSHYRPVNQYSAETVPLCSAECMSDYLDSLSQDPEESDEGDEE